MSSEMIETLSGQIETVFFVIGGAILLIELAEAWFKGELKGRSIKEMLVSASTQIPSIAAETLIFTAAYGVYFVVSQTVAPWSLPLNGWTLLLALLVADFIYYWEHRIAHRVRVLWTQHAVHHSSRDFNIATSLRFGPLEGVWPAIIHLPKAFVGFSPEMIFFGVLSVLAYQTWIHTELIGKLGPLEKVLNTPSHHRVHHGADDKYLDKNYAGILIIWDRMFGTFQEEEETPRYGLKRDFNSQNPIQVWFSELPELWRDLKKAKSIKEFWMRLFAPPGWKST